jgi:hypothetical protein
MRIVSASIAVVVLALCSIPAHAQWSRTVRSGSHGHPVSLGSHPGICAYLAKPDGLIEVSGSATVATLANYPNFFQIAGPKASARLEAAPDGTVGAAFTRSVGGGTGLSVDPPMTVHQTWTFSLTVTAEGAVTLQVGTFILNETISGLALTCNDLLVGDGFDASRSVRGTVHSIIFEGGTREARVPAEPELAVMGALVLFWILAGTIAGPRRGRKVEGPQDD